MEAVIRPTLATRQRQRSLYVCSGRSRPKPSSGRSRRLQTLAPRGRMSETSLKPSMVADRQTPTWRLLGVEFRGKAAEALGSTLRACLITSWDPRTPRPP